MENTNNIKSHDKFAATYDLQAKQYNSYGPEALFGMCYQYIKPKDNLLDLGIGTGLSSVNFAKAGLNIFGFDESLEMLKECQKKGFTSELKQHSILDIPFPYSNKAFSNIICCGVFHFFGNLEPIIKETYRILKPNGIFAFTIASLTKKEAAADYENMPNYIEVQSAWGVPIFKHSNKYVENIAKTFGLTIHKEQKVLVDSGIKDSDDILFKIIVMQKTNH